MKMLKTKHFRRLAVFLAMIAPAVYLFGSLFNALAGAHGTEVFAEPVYVDSFVSADAPAYGTLNRLIIDNSNRISWLESLLTVSYSHRRDFICSFGEVDIYGYKSDSTSSFNSFDFYTNPERTSFTRFAQRTRSSVDEPWSYSFNVSTPWVFIGDFNGVADFVFTANLEILVSVPSSEVPENAGAYSDYIFKNFFAKDNFLVEWGRDAISENPHGFAPFGAFWRYLDVNVLHLGNQQIGLMGYGYVYYACHVLLFDIGFILVTFFLDFIQKVNDRVVGGVD